MMCAVSRIEFASRPLGLFASGNVTGRWRKHDCASHPWSVAFTHMVPASHAGIVPLIKPNGLRGVSATITALWRIDIGGHKIVAHISPRLLDLIYENLGRQSCRSNWCWNIPSYSWNLMRNQCKYFSRIVNRYAAAVHLPSTNAYQRIWQRRDTACVCCYCV